MPGAVSAAVVMGVGNLLRQDEGVGVHAIRALADAGCGSAVELVDGGTAVFDALSSWSEIGRLVVIDALQGAGEPGAILRLTPQETEDRTEIALSLHQQGLLDSLAMLRHSGVRIGEVVIYGVEPAQMGWGTELSEPVARCLPQLVAQVEDELDISPTEEKQR